jgi:membrane protease YdiL (CAAX protease family)
MDTNAAPTPSPAPDAEPTLPSDTSSTPLSPSTPVDPSAADEPAVAEHAPATPYHRMMQLRPEWSHWLKPILTMGATAVAQVVFAYLVLVGIVSLLALLPGIDPLAIGRDQGDPASPMSVFVALALGAFTLVAGFAGIRLGGWRPVRTVWSVEARFRREVFRRGAWWILPLCALAVIGSWLLVARDHGGLGPRGSILAVLGVLLITIVLVPLRAAGEEVVFRGIGQQGIGTWLQHPAWAILIPVPLSLIGRGYTDSAGAMVGAALISLCCGVLAWKTGGLELPILLQLGTFGFTALLAPFGGPIFPGQGPGLLPTVLVALLVTVIAVLDVDHRYGFRITEPVQRPSSAQVPKPTGI